MKNNVLQEISKFKPHEQLVLLSSRYLLSEDERKYIDMLIKRYDMNWSEFLGIALINRVNGVVYNNIKEYNDIPKYVKYFLEVAYREQKERTVIHQTEILRISEEFEKEKMNYSLLKGAVLNTVFYKPGDRISNDTDILVDVKDIDKAVNLLEKLGYIQGEVINGELKPATKKEILFARLNTYEIVPLNKPIESRYMSFHEVDINFRLGNDDKQELASIMLQDTINLVSNGQKIRTLSLEKFLLFLCIHHYREATMIYKIASGDDLTLYKFMDIHFFVSQRNNEINWDKLLELSQTMGKQKDVYYTLFHSEMLYPGTFEIEILEKFKLEDVSFINEYRGKDNSDEVYKWETEFIQRAFSYKRREEAMKNIETENKRFQNICQQLKN